MTTKTLRPYQVENTIYIKAGNSLICDDPGLGKTLSAIVGVRPQGQLPPTWCALVICPLRVGPQWAAEITSQYPYDPVYIGTQDTFFLRRPGWTVTHYDAVRSILPKKGESQSRINKADGMWDVIICDEAHRISNRKSLQTKAIKRLQARRKVALTGTPMEKSPAEMWSILHWLYPKRYTSYWAFYNKFIESEPQWRGRGHKILGLKNEGDLAALVKTLMTRHTKVEVAKDLPPKIVIPTRILLGETQREVYQRIKEATDIVIPVDESGPDFGPLIITNVLAEITRLQQVTSYPPQLGFKAPSAKIEWTLEWLDDHPDESVVIFTRFRATASHLQTLLGKEAELLVGGTGAVPAGWLAGRSRILIGTIAAMGEGLNLQRASTAIFVDQEWSTIKMTQAYDRIHRLDITEPKVIYLLHCANTVDNLILEALTNKWSQTELVYAALSYLRNHST